MTEQTNVQSQFSISEAAKWIGKTRRTLQRHIANGKISVKEDNQGRKYIEASELQRVYPEDFNQPNRDDTMRQTPEKSQDDASDTVQTLQERISNLEQENAELRKDKEDLRQDKEQYRQEKDRLLKLVEQQQALLPAPSEDTAPAKKRTLFERLLGGKQQTIEKPG